MKQRYKDEVEFQITCRMKARWVPSFLSMLKHMMVLGNMGSSRMVSIYSDGDGDFRPQFDFHENLKEPVDPVKDVNGDVVFDAG